MIITQVSSEDHIHQILSLQRANIKSALTIERIKKEGFVTCQHDFELLSKMNHPHPHIICLHEGKVVGYCLVMSPIWRHEVKVLKSMFDKIQSLRFNHTDLSASEYIIMGQVCIHKNYRGAGIFRRMYEYFRMKLTPYFEYCITEVDSSNLRSLNAHYAIGFKTLLSYQPGDGHSWELIIWDWRK